MKFLLHGRTGKYLLHAEILVPTLEAGIEKAKKLVEERLNADKGFEYVSVELHLRLPPVWHRTNHGEDQMSRNGILAELEELHPAA